MVHKKKYFYFFVVGPFHSQDQAIPSAGGHQSASLQPSGQGTGFVRPGQSFYSNRAMSRAGPRNPRGALNGYRGPSNGFRGETRQASLKSNVKSEKIQCKISQTFFLFFTFRWIRWVSRSIPQHAKHRIRSNSVQHSTRLFQQHLPTGNFKKTNTMQICGDLRSHICITIIEYVLKSRVFSFQDGYQQSFKRGATQGPRGCSRGNAQAMRS